MSSRYTLRDLPGVADLEERLRRMEAHPNPLWAPEFDDIWERVDQLSKRLFGVTEEEIGIQLEVDNEGAPWRGLLLEQGWNVDDADGMPMIVFPYLVTAIICAIEGKAGRLPDAPRSDQEVAELASEWGEDLAAAAAKFRSERRQR